MREKDAPLLLRFKDDHPYTLDGLKKREANIDKAVSRLGTVVTELGDRSGPSYLSPREEHPGFGRFLRSNLSNLPMDERLQSLVRAAQIRERVAEVIIPSLESQKPQIQQKIAVAEAQFEQSEEVRKINDNLAELLRLKGKGYASEQDITIVKSDLEALESKFVVYFKNNEIQPSAPKVPEKPPIPPAPPVEPEGEAQPKTPLVLDPTDRSVIIGENPKVILTRLEWTLISYVYDPERINEQTERDVLREVLKAAGSGNENVVSMTAYFLEKKLNQKMFNRIREYEKGRLGVLKSKWAALDSFEVTIIGAPAADEQPPMSPVEPEQPPVVPPPTDGATTRFDTLPVDEAKAALEKNRLRAQMDAEAQTLESEIALFEKHKPGIEDGISKELPEWEEQKTRLESEIETRRQRLEEIRSGGNGSAADH